MENKHITGIPAALNAFISDGTPDEIVFRYASLTEVAKSHDFGDLDHNIVVIDTETTGFSFNHDELIQIAAARMEQGKIIDWYVTFVNPGKPIPEEVARLTNIHDEDVIDAPSPNEALAGLVEFAGDAKLVAHNVDFDRTFTTRHPSGYPLLENTWIDSLDLSRIALPRLKSHRLIDLVKAFGLPLSTHRADDDVASTCAVLRVLFAAVYEMPLNLTAFIASLASQEEWSSRIVFDEITRQKAANTAIPRFSLRSIRDARVCTREFNAKADADDIAADPIRNLTFPSSNELSELFSRDGLLGRMYDDYEPRKEQCTMGCVVGAAFERSENLIVEAGTGVGKSMAYLVPSVLLAKRNNITVGVATKTNALLDQLVYHELPALAAALQDTYPDMSPLTYASLKGFSHYPCLRRIDQIAASGAHMKEVAGKSVSQAPAIAALLSYIEQTEYDDMDSLKLDYRVLPRKAVTTTSHDCLRRKCPYFNTSCFVHGQRRHAEHADIIVTNHSLLFCDLAADGGLLPPVRYWVVDEAHGAEQEARRAFSVSLEAEDLLRAAARAGADESARNVFIAAERRVDAGGNGEKATLFYTLTSRAKSAGKMYAEAAAAYAEHMKDMVFFAPGKRGRGYDIAEVWLNDDVRRSATFAHMATFADTLIDAAEKLVTTSQELVAYLEDVEGAAEVQREIASLAMEAKRQINALELIIRSPSDKYAYSATVSRKQDRVMEKQEALLVEVGGKLNETLFARTHSVVFASATLSVNGTFTAFESALGLNTGEFSHARTCMLDSSYDFDTNMIIYVVSDIPEPMDPSYLSKLQSLLIATHIAQQGSMLTLFTNRREMEACFNEVQPCLKAHDLRLVCQKWGVSVKGLRDDFLADEHLSLFALKSFWEGFDAPGATLKGIIIPKLPFAKPTDPLSCERAARDDQAWRKYVLPQAILETKQAAGRLIRKADDTGALILADKRLLTKSYGRAFLNSMPSRTVKVMTTADIIADIAAHAVRKG
ncbi:helicase C-terminal domain-containing protein [Adlercreutzia sp. ZJ141]|uniref:helicase C-terminal domain-containing protein n=1 Tax=Adlercreutzia sp. ZJ141 TaxID=2709406 RepID=UPI0013EB1AEC|nr:helicase C-terminal domain-containing protein [Adlercreutzia sp. ZJ141]